MKKESTEDQKYFLEDFFELRNFFVKILTDSTAGWSNGSTFKIFPSVIVLRIIGEKGKPAILGKKLNDLYLILNERKKFKEDKYFNYKVI